MRAVRLLLFALAVLLLAATRAPLASPPAAHATFPGDNGKIAYTDLLTDHSQITIVNADGSDPTTLGPGATPSWSADGQQIVFVSGDDNADVFIMNADGTGRRNVTNTPDEHEQEPSFSPDGDEIAFWSFSATGIPTQSLAVINTDGTGYDELLYTEYEIGSQMFGADTTPQWSLDGEKILYSSAVRELLPTYSDLYLIDRFGGTPQNLTSSPNISEWYPSWSPNGTQIVFANSLGIAVMNATLGGATEQLTADPNHWRADWSPDGSRMVVQANTVPPVTYTMTNHGEQLQEIPGVVGYQPRWQPLTSLVTVEFTQAAQDLQSIAQLKADLEPDGEPPVPLIAGKQAVMRVYLDESDDSATYTVRSNLGPDQQVTVESFCSASDRRALEDGCASVDFYFTPRQGDWTATLQLLNEEGQIVEDHEFEFTSRQAPRLILVVATVCHHEDPPHQWLCGDETAVNGLANYLRAIMPTHEVRVVRNQSWIFREQGEPPDTWRRAILSELKTRRAADPFPTDNVVYVGVVAPNAPLGALGVAWRNDRVLAFKSQTTTFGVVDTAETLAHELGHSLGRPHTGTAAPLTTAPPGCLSLAAADDGTDWPFESNHLNTVGFDVLAGEAKPGTEWFDIMGYCNPQWVSAFTYKKLLEALGPAVPAAAPLSAQTTGEQWVVSGSITGNVATLDPLTTLEATPTTGSGPYRVEAQGAGGAVLAQQAFGVTEGGTKPEEGAADAELPPSFTVLLPVQAGAERIAVLQGAVELGSIELEGAPPSVTFEFAPNGPVSGEQLLSWTVTDPDSPSFKSSLEYSTDGGATYTPIALGLPSDGVFFDFDLLAGSANAVLRVRVSDGVNTGMATVGPFTVAEKGPEARILSPGQGDLFRAGQAVTLQADAADAEDGTLEGGAVRWSSSRDGELGTGPSLAVTDLSVGQHTITLTARDSDNHVSTDTATITVWDAPLEDGQLNGDADCSAEITVDDALLVVLHAGGEDAGQPSGCGDIDTTGDTECDGAAEITDAVAILRRVADVPGAPAPGCRPVGV